MKRRTALLSAGIAAGAVTAGVVSRTVARRRHHGAGEPIGAVPPEDLGTVISFDGTELAVRGAGRPDAPIVLLSHGFSLDMSVWCDTWPALVGDLRVVAFDHRSHGASGRAAGGDLTIRAMGRDLGAVLGAVAGERPAVIVGHSMGAMAILALAEQRPELFDGPIAGVVLMGAASSDLLKGAMGSVTELLRPRLGSLSSAAERVNRLRKALMASPVDVSGVVARVTQFGPDAPSRVVDHVVTLAQRTASEVWTEALPDLMEMDLRHALPRIGVPSLVLVGEHDRVTPPAAAVELAAALPEGRLTLIEGAGHIPMLERPDAVNEAITGFARSVFGLDRPKRGRKGAA
ncbi:MAG: alpha/beta fold hydrolase [Actinomycetota bacterium]